MAIKYTKNEIAVIEEKETNPGKLVMCPRCGKPLQFFDCKSGYEIKCGTDDCIRWVVRGI